VEENRPFQCKTAPHAVFTESGGVEIENTSTLSFSYGDGEKADSRGDVLQRNHRHGCSISLSRFFYLPIPS
jgi:hypothetical protein